MTDINGKKLCLGDIVHFPAVNRTATYLGRVNGGKYLFVRPTASENIVRAADELGEFEIIEDKYAG